MDNRRLPIAPSLGRLDGQPKIVAGQGRAIGPNAIQTGIGLRNKSAKHVKRLRQKSAHKVIQPIQLAAAGEGNAGQQQKMDDVLVLRCVVKSERRPPRSKKHGRLRIRAQFWVFQPAD